MNKNLYRIIFNKPRGLLMAVAENVGGGGKAAGASDVPGQLASPAILGVLRPVCCSVLLAFGLAASLSDIAQAQVVADPGAPANQQPTVVTSANGTVQVNIQSPSAAGVSRNAYSQFDVNQQGVILNNARTNVQTQLGGWVQGNPWLAAGTARVILNEVNSSNPSQLRGYVEVAGDRAQVVIANPAGISCDGCGFLNANRVTLTTGTPIVNSGNLEGYRVQQGAVTVEGAGMDTSRADYTDIIARSVQVNAGIWANTLKLSAGANEVNAGHTQITPVAASGAAPAYAIDVANLGGMYAGKIFLTGSESGVGVRNSGLIAAAAGDVIVTSDGLLENGGRIASAGDAHLDANGGIVNSGIVYAQGAARIVAQGMIDNKGGDIQAQGNISIDVGTGRVDNTGSLIRSGGALDIRAASVENANTQGADQGIEAQLVDIAAGQINNQSGAIRAAASLALTGSGALENTLGLISSGQTLAILDRDLASKTLAITNTGGTLIAGTSLNVDSATLSGDGDVLSQGDLAVRLSGDYVHTGNLLANGNASLETAGNVTNLAAMQAGNGLAISAANIDNTASGQISATTTHVSADGTLINRGLIDGQETAITANAVSNLGTGRIYGDHLSIGATTLANDAENGAAPVIAARNRLDIGAQTITNREHALIFSAGDMAIGGNLDANKQATGQAATLNNASATIEALGSLTLSAYQINNTNEHFSTQVVPVSSQSFNEFQGEGAGTRYPASSVYQHHVRDSFYQWVIGGIAYNRSYQYDYTRTITETQVQSSDPAQILSGGAMNLSANSLLNDKSRIIAGGALTGNLGSLTNSEVAGERVSTEAGTAYHYIDHQPGGCCNDWTEIQITGYNPAPSVAGISLTPTVYQQNTAPNGSGTAIGTLAIASVNQSAGGANPTPLSSLFNSAPNPNAGYLIETDPRFASYRTWLSSDYLLNALEIDPAITHKRLGDGFYEQKLVREQVAQLTGRRFLDGYANDEAQYQALLGNAVTYAQAHQLRPGVALSAGQMAQLTSDIVWLVEKTVTLPNGQTTQALVPQLYMRVRDGDLQTSGALLAASSVSLNLSGDLSNSGTIAGRSVVSLSAENVRNLGGRISGNDLGIQARTDLDNIGGTIEAMHTLSASAGRDLNVLSTTRTQTNAQGSRTHIDRVAGLYVTGSGGTLMATAGRDLNLDAAAILNAAASPSPLAEEGAGSTTLAAGNNLKLGTVSEAQQHDLAWDSRNYRKENSRSDIGTTIQTQGDLRLSAGNDLNAKAASVTSEQGELLATAGRNITLSAGEANDQRDEASYSQSRGNWGSKKTVATRDTLNETTALTSTFTGKTAVLDAGNDIHIEGGQIKALNTIALLAGNDIHLTAAENTRTESHLRDEKTSGLSTRGYKKQSNEASDTLDQITHSGSRLGSETGNIVLAANLNNTQDMNKGLILIEGSEIRAGNGKIDLTGQHIILTASEDLSSSERTRKESNRTWAFATGLPSGTQHGLDAVGQSRTLNGSTLQSAQGITLDAQGVIDITASQLKADQGDIHIKGAEN
ncbi:MAG: filamentous hemagglutinin N-terminal domain-containing protein, partial [Sulfuricella sp.]